MNLIEMNMRSELIYITTEYIESTVLWSRYEVYFFLKGMELLNKWTNLNI